jgi:prolyl-tRNA synthetase
MKISHLLGLRFKETPADCQITSHILMVRGGYIKNVGSGIFSLYAPAKRIMQKIEAIIREEMNRINGQEVMLPVAMPSSLWKESGRFDSVGSELLRFKDRSGNDMVLGMTHEEAVVHLARGAAPSYTHYPFMVYQIQTKFRDEPRARAGLIRVREFTMKDAYSFHTSQGDLEEYYAECHKAYERIYARVGLPEVISVQSDSGMMGGKIAHEFMLLNEVGEDTLIICDSCDFRANMEAAGTIVETPASAEDGSEPDRGAIAKALEGSACPACGKNTITAKNGIEVGNIFQLGIKYTESMGMQYVDKDGNLQYPIMGCYGIGVGRLAASVCEARHDKFGPIWPISIAPWQVHLCALMSDTPEVADAAAKIYDGLMKAGIEVIFDDRAVSPGVMFSDADLLGCPLRLIVSPKTCQRNAVEFVSRDKELKMDLPLDLGVGDVGGIVGEVRKRCL